MDKYEMWDVIVGSPKYRLSTCYGTNSDIQDFMAIMTKEMPENDNLITFGGNAGATKMFVVALLIGYIHKERSKASLEDNHSEQFRYANALNSVQDLREIARLVFLRTFPDESDEFLKKFIEADSSKNSEEEKLTKAIFANFCSYADGGIEILRKNFQEHGKIDFDEIRSELNTMMDEQVPELIEEPHQQEQK